MQFPFVANTRILDGRMTGVQRVLSSILEQFPTTTPQLAPMRVRGGLRGHFWEQTVLPLQLQGRLLWSPSTTGPLVVRRQVVTCHDLGPFDVPDALNPKFVAWYKWLLPQLYRRVERIIAISDFTKQRIHELLGIPEDRITVVHNGIGDQFQPVSDKLQAVCGRLGIVPGRYLLSVGSVQPYKNLNRLLRAWKSALPELPDDLMLLVVGAAGLPHVYRQMTFDPLPERVRFLGAMLDDDLPTLYSCAQAFLFPSYYEGFGLPVLEAMACGTPVIAARAASIPEVAGDAAHLFNPFNVDALAQSLLDIQSSDYRKKLRSAGLERSKLFNWQKTAAATWSILTNSG